MIEIIKKEDVDKLISTETGDFIVPDQYIILEKGETLDELTLLSIRFHSMTEPTDEELIELGKQNSEYYKVEKTIELMKRGYFV